MPIEISGNPAIHGAVPGLWVSIPMFLTVEAWTFLHPAHISKAGAPAHSRIAGRSCSLLRSGSGIFSARVLRDEGFTEATTVEDFLRNAEKRGGLRRAVVICDEAGLKSNRQGAELLRLAQKHDLRVLLVGDVRQHVSVEAGDFLRVLETHSQLRRCRVEQIHRQRQAAYRGAVERMAAGDVRGGLAALDRLDWIKESQSNYLEKAAADYLRLTGDGKQLDGCLAVSFTWRKIIASRTQSAVA